MIRIDSSFPVIKILEDDVIGYEELLQTADSPFNRRGYIRAVFAYLEGVCSLLRRKTEAIMISQHLHGKRPLNISRAALLSDTSFKISDNGTLQKIDQRQPYKIYFAFTIRSYAEESGISENYFGLDGWNKLQNSIKVRHRITHPKKDSEMGISDIEITGTKMALDWFGKLIIDISTNATITEIIN